MAKKNSAAVALGRKGGKASVAKGFSMMTPEQRKAAQLKSAAKRAQNSLDWQPANELDAPRYVRVRDDVMTYCSEIPKSMALSAACDHFAATYDHNGEAGTVACSGALLVNGEEFESRQFDVDA